MKIRKYGLLRRITAARFVMCLVLIVVACGKFTTPARAAGIITHANVVGRAIELVDEQKYPDLVAILTEYKDIVNYGSMYPDWPFTILDPELSEAIHDTCWTLNCSTHSFRDALAANLAPVFKNPQSEEDYQAIAFLFGVIAHQETDNPWHFSQPDAPLALEAALSSENPKYGTPVEFLAELFVARFIYAAENKPKNWYPSDALMAAFKEIGKSDVTLEDLKNGAVRQNIVFYVEMTVANLPIPMLWQSASQPIVFFFENYPAGGLDDCAEYTARAWERTWDRMSTY
jgi:hypothetical protein